ncbi:MAG: aldolase/citrate lyase family protein [Gammaproteobacteria bacterium]
MKRINRCIDLLEAGHPVYYTEAGPLSYEHGLAQASTWADFLVVDFERDPFDVIGLAAFMRGIVDGGPTPDGYRMTTVLATLPSNCRTRAEVEANAWQVRHVLSAGVHGVLHTHVRNADAARAFVECCRFPIHASGLEAGLKRGERGAGGHIKPAELWGVAPDEYTHRADPWPLNPRGELLLGVKLEDRYCLENAVTTAAVPGLAFAEWGPGDMGMSYGYPDAHDPPYPEPLERARHLVKAACDDAGLYFLSAWNDPEMDEQTRLKYLFDWGAMIISGASAQMKAAGIRMRPRV